MKKEGIFGLLFCALVISVLSLGVSSASFSYKNSTIIRDYSTGDTIKGTVNVSFFNEPAASLLTSNFNNNINLIGFLRNSGFAEGTDYSCTKRNCSTDYAVSDEINTLTLGEGEQKLIGIKVNGNNVAISSLKFSLTSDRDSSCLQQLKIDVLDKNETFIQNLRGTTDLCGSTFNGCFDSGASSEMAIISSNLYCENISLPSAPAYYVGATIKNGTKTSQLKMQLYDSNWNSRGECILPKNTQDTDTLGCRVNLTSTSTEQQNYFVCISGSNLDAEFQIKVEHSGTNCGTDDQGNTFSLDYDLFARTYKFAPVGTIGVNESVFSNQNNAGSLASYADKYIEDNYGRNCSNDCIIPFSVTGDAQAINISDVSLQYTKGGGSIYSSTAMFSLTKEDSKISTAKPILINLEKAGFEIPAGYSGDKLFSFYIGGNSVFPSPIPINITTGFVFDVTPKNFLVGIETTFRIIMNGTLLYSNWDFGDGTSNTTSQKSVTHRYTSLPSGDGYNLAVEVARNDGAKSKKTFKITTGNIADSVRNITAIDEARLKNLTAKINAFPKQIADKIRERLGIDNLNSTITNIKKALDNATDSDYAAFATSLASASVPYDVYVKEEGNGIPLSIGLANIDTGYIEEISNMPVDAASEGKLKSEIVSWIEKYYELKTDYQKIYADFDSGTQAVLTSFKVTITPKETNSESAYFILDRPRSSITFLSNYSDKSVKSGVYIPFSGAKNIEFLLSDDVKVAELGAYISPNINNIFSRADLYQAQGFKWGSFLILILVLLVAAFIVYIILQEWYKRHYESSLFKNKDDLYNLLSFIHQSRKAGMEDDDIKKKLKDFGWSGERLTYAFNKIDGKRLGMLEIPIFRSFELKKVQEEIAKRPAQSLLKQGKI